jgi:hypothetical protein
MLLVEVRCVFALLFQHAHQDMSRGYKAGIVDLWYDCFTRTRIVLRLKASVDRVRAKRAWFLRLLLLDLAALLDERPARFVVAAVVADPTPTPTPAAEPHVLVSVDIEPQWEDVAQASRAFTLLGVDAAVPVEVAAEADRTLSARRTFLVAPHAPVPSICPALRQQASFHGDSEVEMLALPSVAAAWSVRATDADAIVPRALTPVEVAAKLMRDGGLGLYRGKLTALATDLHIPDPHGQHICRALVADVLAAALDAAAARDDGSMESLAWDYLAKAAARRSLLPRSSISRGATAAAAALAPSPHRRVVSITMPTQMFLAGPSDRADLASDSLSDVFALEENLPRMHTNSIFRQSSHSLPRQLETALLHAGAATDDEHTGELASVLDAFVVDEYVRYVSDDGYPYYVNTRTNESRWDLPEDAVCHNG